jgi:enterochelin esterase-like enzyme
MSGSARELFSIVAASVALLLSSSSLRTQVPPTEPPSESNFRPIEASARILALKQRLQDGDRHALEEFWRQAAQMGTPLIEPAKNSSSEVVVTFVWRGDASTEKVALLAPLEKSPGMPTIALTRLLDTDVWYKCWQMRDDLRFTYRFVVARGSAERSPEQAGEIDRLNPHRMELLLDEGQPPMKFSIAAMPRGQDEEWVRKRPRTPEGSIEKQSFESAILHNKRNIWIYTPPGYKAESQPGYPLLVLFDGFAYQNWIPVPTILNNLIHAERVPALCAVLVGNAEGARGSELGGYNTTFGKFLTEELLPWAHAHWNLTRDPKKSIVGGFSFGGSAATFIGMEHPDVFGNVLSQSGAFWSGNNADVKWEWLAQEYEVHDKLPLRFYLEAGRLEDMANGGPTLLAANRHLVSILRHKGYDVTYKEAGGTHEPVHWRGEFADGLMFLLH